MRYIIFSRVSTGKQTTENQILECRAYVDSQKKEGDQVIEFDESNVSTRLSIEERPVLKEMLASLRKGDTLVIYKLSRLARAGNELVTIYTNLMKQGVNLCSLYEKQVDEMMIHAYAMVGQAERRNIRENTISGLNRKKAKMERVGSTWYGYKLDETQLCTNKDSRCFGKPYKLVEDPREQEAISIMVRIYEEGETYREIVNQLTLLGFRNRKGNRFSHTVIYKIIHRLEKQGLIPTLEEVV
jgi:DNA invertase Pin-like site-specific DNA recombinase